MERMERFYQIDGLLRERRDTTMARLLEKLEVSASTVKRDLQYLRDRFEAPIHWHPEKGYYYKEGESFQLPGLWLNASELHALLAAQQLLSQVQAGLLESCIQPLKHRIQQLLKSSDQSWQEVTRRVKILQKATRPIEPEAFRLVSHAVLSRKQLHINYYDRQNNRSSQRLLSPQRLVYYRDNWYLDAYCHLREQLRTFALDNIQSNQIEEKPAIDINETELEQQLSNGYGIFAGSETQTATLRFTPQRARWISKERWHPEQQGHFDEQGNYLLKIPYSQPTELIMDILKYGADVEVLTPPILRQAVIQRVEQVKKMYEKNLASSPGELAGGV